MRAMVLTGARLGHVRVSWRSRSRAQGLSDVLVKVLACGVCRTRRPRRRRAAYSTIPIVPGHEIVGRVEQSVTT